VGFDWHRSSLGPVFPRRVLGSFFLLCLIAETVQGQGSALDYERAHTLPSRTAGLVYRTDVEPRWLPGGTSFWYRVRTGKSSVESVVVDAVLGTRTLGEPPAAVMFVEEDITHAPSASGEQGEETEITVINEREEAISLFWLDQAGRRKSYGTIPPGERRSQHTFAGHVWLMADRDGGRLAVVTADAAPTEVVVTAALNPVPEPARSPAHGGSRSPDGQWRIDFREHNALLVSLPDKVSRPITDDGTADEGYRGRVHWSPDSRWVAMHRIREAEARRIHIVEALPRDQSEPLLHTFPYRKPGDPLPKPTLVVFDIQTLKRVEVPDALYPNPFTESGELRMEWSGNGDELLVSYNQRGHQVYRIFAVNPETGITRIIVEETTSTFIDVHKKTWRHWLHDSRELLWMSERDGWAHLYLMDVATGRVKNQITRGEWVVREIEHVDEAARQVWFYAGGIVPGHNPYYLHLCRVNFDGSGLVVLTEGDGTHSVRFSPDRRWFLDTWSRVDMPLVTELRRSSDGGLVVELERGDDSALRAAGWRVPERFSAPGRDGVTPIHGIIITPSQFDPKKRYPVIEDIYAGPHGTHVPTAYTRMMKSHQLAELGFVVVRIDGMGTNFRSKAFHDVCWKNLGDGGFPDRIAWMKAAAKERPWMDISRVGIFGGSAGGQNALRALLAHGDFYQAAAADCGCHDNRMDKIWWNEQWMGWPIGPHYAEQSNVTQAHRLQGKLLLTVGELDRNVDPASTMQVSAALIRANKDFELIVLPSQGHGAGESPYAVRRRMDFFVRALHGVEPRHKGATP
jgi:dipeptidyl-peptidase 4